MTEKLSVAWVEIYHYELHCTCGHKTESTYDPRPDSGRRVCEACGKEWWAPGAADCEPMEK